MIILILDTSTEKGIVTISEGKKILFSQNLILQGRNSSVALSEGIAQGFSHLNLQSSDIQAIACGSGPGFFTGIRTAVAFAKGFALGAKIPLLGFSSLSGFISPEEGEFVSLIDARIGGAYALFQKNVGGVIEEMGPPAYYSWEELKEKIGSKKIVTPNKLSWGEGREVFPDPVHLAGIVEGKLLTKEYSLKGELPIHYLK